MGWFQEEIERREAAIHAEIAELGRRHPWAGTYFASVPLMFDARVIVAPCAGFIDFNRPDAHPSIPMYGDVVESGGELHFTTFLSEKWSVTPVHWGDRHYLIPERSFLSFCQEINADIESRSPNRRVGRFLRREGDGRIAASGLPTLPENFLRCIFKQQIFVTILTVEEEPQNESPLDRLPYARVIRVFRATIDRGSDDGLFPEGQLYEFKASEIQTGHLLEVGPHQSVMKIYTEHGQAAQVGSIFTTRPVSGSMFRW